MHFKNVICRVCVRHEGMKVQYGKLDRIAPHSKQLITDFIAAGVVFVCKSFLNTGISSNLKGLADHRIRSKTDIETVFDVFIVIISYSHDRNIFAADMPTCKNTLHSNVYI